MSDGELTLFDCNCMLGRNIYDRGESFDDVVMLRTHMDRYRIKKTLVYSAFAKLNWPMQGNTDLQEAVYGEPDIYTQWIVLPDYTDEFPCAGDLRKMLHENKVSAVRMCPVKHAYSMEDWCCGRILRVLNEMRIPVFLDYELLHFSGAPPYDEIYRLCLAYPQIPFVIVRAGFADNRRLFALLEQCPNLHFDTSYYESQGGIEAVAERFGAGRMLFGTGAPIFAPSCAIGILYYSDITDAEKRMIACENLENLINGIIYK